MKSILTMFRPVISSKLFSACSALFPAAVFLVIPRIAVADIYTVDRSFAFGAESIQLTGTMEIPEGNYTITNGGPSPFTTFDLTLTVNGTPFSLPYVVTSGYIYGTGEFFIDATPTNLVFNTANGNLTNPADLVFSALPYASDAATRYAIGSDGDPAFEAGFSSVGGANVSVMFPVVFGAAAVPEPSSLTLVALGSVAFFRCRHTRCPH